ncbi:VQ motif-containing protein 8, chloroplastic-like [Hibiscus syriacus]|uniref:VQ motif-containing protein 8, chloroplastic-like n=1 Tax=Hibiscus syriacus TaxID=106335 RepID=UPI00192346A5|nr:VQ motif-containing protein 8, chloroplastic-like [Hibiscus syriacus]
MSFNSESCEIKHSTRGRSSMQGPRPFPLKVSDSSLMIKKSSHNNIQNRIGSSGKVSKPVVIYLRSPKIIHVRPEEFTSLVQRLTGKDSLPRDRSYDRPPSSTSWSMVGDTDESMAVAPPAKVAKRSGSLFDAELWKLAFNGVEHGDQILQLSPTWMRFLACV